MQVVGMSSRGWCDEYLSHGSLLVRLELDLEGRTRFEEMKMRMMLAARRVPTSLGRLTVALLVLALAACGGGDADSDGGTDTPADSGDTGDATAVSTDTGTSADVTTGDSGGGAMATLTVGDNVYTWTAEQMGTCEINGIFGPANAEFGVPPSQGGEGPWVQFIDRGDGGVNFSAVLEGEEYSGTGPGEADEIRSGGFTYTGDMGSGGERFEVELEVQC